MHAFGFQLAHQGDDLLLGRLHLLDLHRAQRVHVLAQHFGAALRHAAQDVVPQLFAGAFERHRQDLAVHLADHFLQAQGIDQQQVFEDEHEVADGLDQVGVLLLDVVEDPAAGAGIEAVEHLRHGAHAAVGFAAEFAQGLELLARSRRRSS